MPQINYNVGVSALTGRTQNEINTKANPDSFGYSVGKSQEELGAAQQQFGQAVGTIAIKEKEREKKEELANKMAQFDFTKRELELRNEVDADGRSYQERVLSEYRDAVENYTSGIEDDDVRIALKTKLVENTDNISGRAAAYEFTQKAENSKLQADTSLNTLQNRVTSDPLFYDAALEQGNAVIDSRPGMTAGLKASMKETWKQDNVKRRFQGMLSNAKTEEDVDNIALDLAGKTGRDWSTEFLPSDFEKLMNDVGTMKKTFQTRNDADGRAVVTTLEDRTKEETVLIPQDELQQAQQVVKRTTDPVIRQRMARVARDQDIIKTEQKLPPSELRARINAVNGNPGLAYPDLPPVVSDAVNQASETFGINAGFLGGMANREYGQYFKKPKVDLQEKFKPQVAHKDMDLRNVRADVVNAVTAAGQSYGAPLIVTAGDKQDKSGTSISISTVGMSEEQKGKVTASLVDSGFTGFAEYDGVLRVDMRQSVPNNFAEQDGKVWGGWTYLSPTVANTLKEKGFAAGADQSTIKRNPLIKDEPIDYGKPTGIVDENGKPTSSAVGVMQFTDDTWLFTIKNPTVAAAIGVGIEGKTDAELLELRKDPRLSIMAGAAYAAKNQKVLENVLGRTVNDGELYMAHFMGGDGAVTFLTGYKNNPDQLAADLMPSAAKANKPVFYDKKGNALTVRQVYDNISQEFAIAPSRVAFEDNRTRERLLKKAEEGLKTDPITYASSVGSHSVLPLDQDGGFAARGSTARSIADYYSISMNEMKPFTEDEATAIKKQIDEGDSDAAVAMMANISTMGEKPARAALKQMGEKDKVFAHAADLYVDGAPSVAGDIMRGRKKINDNPAILEQIGAQPQELNDRFVSQTGPALHDLEPERRQAIQDAALAYYVQHSTSSTFSKQNYDAATQAVMGGTKTSPAVATVNGTPTVLPRNVSPDMMEAALQNMKIEDYIRLSYNGAAPRYRDGSVVDPYDIKDEVSLRSIGGGKYKMMLDDGSVLLTGNITSTGRAEAYIFVPDKQALEKISTRAPVVSRSEKNTYYPGTSMKAVK